MYLTNPLVLTSATITEILNYEIGNIWKYLCTFIRIQQPILKLQIRMFTIFDQVLQLLLIYLFVWVSCVTEYNWLKKSRKYLVL